MTEQTFILKDTLVKVLEENEATIRKQSIMAAGEESISRENAASLKGQASLLTEVLKVVKSGAIDYVDRGVESGTKMAQANNNDLELQHVDSQEVQ